jgi:hypothetical protein
MVIIWLMMVNNIFLTGAKRREWMGMDGNGINGMIITSDYGLFPKIPCV